MKSAQGTWKPCHGGMEMDALSSFYIIKLNFKGEKKKNTHILNSPSGSVHLVINLPSLMKKHLHQKIQFNMMQQELSTTPHLNSAQQPLYPRPCIPSNQLSTGTQKSFPEPGIHFFTNCYSHCSWAGSHPPSHHVHPQKQEQQFLGLQT